MFKLILVPLDGSEASEVALGAAELIPSRRVRLLAVESEMLNQTALRTAERDCQAHLDRVAEPLRRQGRKVDTVVVFGGPAQLIVAAAATADLVVMASHGRDTMGAFVLGSVANWVARHAPVPTMIVRTGNNPVKPVPLTRIVVPLDGSPLAEAALPAATELAGTRGLPVHLVRVLDDVDAQRATARAGAYLAARVQQIRNRDPVADSDLRTDPPVVEHLAAIGKGDPLVLATHDRGGLQRRILGSMADKLIPRAASPVVIVRATAPGVGHQRDGKSAIARSTSGSASLAGSAL
jgi:nucleotide-binding universal stress UspA family protein